RALLDVQLEIGAHVVDAARFGNSGEVEAEPGHRVAERDAVRVAPIAELAEVLADERPAAEEGGSEARALLVHERDEPEWPLRLDAPLLEQADRLQPGEDAERAVVAAARGHRVHVRADDGGLARPHVPARDQVAGGVSLHRET